ncbi:hypothetical protein KJ603_01405 [Patescibacteria group bacterium]|nr:hypothetical protein [Patescibacteria group bacterium]
MIVLNKDVIKPLVPTILRDIIKPLILVFFIWTSMEFLNRLTPNTPMGDIELVFGALIGTIVGYLFLFCIWEFFPVTSMERIIEKIRKSILVCRTLQVLFMTFVGILFYWFFTIGVETDNPDRIAFIITVSIFCGMSYGGILSSLLRRKFFPSVGWIRVWVFYF